MNRRRGEGSSLKKYQENPEFLVSSAIQSFRSKKKRTIFVEGVNDKSFLHQWVSDGFRFDGFVGKPVIENLARYINRNHNASKYSSEFLLLADVDYDVTTCIGTVSGVNYFFVGDGGEHIYNDLDVFLFNSLALKKVLSNLRIDISSDEFIELKRKVELASRTVGKYRAADYKLTKGNVEKSILNGLDITNFLDSINIKIDDDEIKESIHQWSSSLDIDDLITEAESLDRSFPQPWALSRGHDISLIISSHISENYKKPFVSQPYIEERLRIGCELHELKNTLPGQSLITFGAINI
ncbi:hypothetical protein [Klebsiella grimontii]|uniref:hypothetical protein n=2 Tax=Klebsiella TaxID=570 RepID=UPI001CCE2711|nr:hypothetical protein [Klebsiella grimontii]MBZ6759210.1 hypothetical protein [Klebsiella grimontii]